MTEAPRSALRVRRARVVHHRLVDDLELLEALDRRRASRGVRAVVRAIRRGTGRGGGNGDERGEREANAPEVHVGPSSKLDTGFGTGANIRKKRRGSIHSRG